MSARYEISEGELDVLAITGPEGTRYIDGEEIEARVIRQQSADLDKLRAELAAAVAERERIRAMYVESTERLCDDLQCLRERAEQAEARLSAIEEIKDRQ